jgi:hypothetical protein
LGYKTPLNNNLVGPTTNLIANKNHINNIDNTKTNKARAGI